MAQAVGMHESTVSRVTTGLLIATPRGGMPLKSFFSVNIASRDSENDTGGGGSQYGKAADQPRKALQATQR